jgi:hypothetical protein
MKKYLISIASSLIIIGLLLFYYFAKHNGTTQEVVKEQKQQIVIQNEIIKDKKIISQRQTIAGAVSTNENLVWLRKHRCKDCESR